MVENATISMLYASTLLLMSKKLSSNSSASLQLIVLNWWLKSLWLKLWFKLSRASIFGYFIDALRIFVTSTVVHFWEIERTLNTEVTGFWVLF